MFAADRDLLVFEPNLFRDVGWLGQRLLAVTGSLTAGVLTLDSGDAESVGVGAGYVALVDSTPVEITERTDPTTMTVSLGRAAVEDPLIPPADAASRPVTVSTFRPQIALAHAQLLAMLGLDVPLGEGPDESSVTNPRDLMRVECLGALNLIYAAAGALSGPGSALWHRAEFYRHRFSEARRIAAARIDTDGDGLPDATRRLNVLQLMRA